MTQLANCFFSLLIKLLYTCATRATIVIIGRHSAVAAAAGEQCAAWLAVLIDRLCVPTECAEIDTARTPAAGARIPAQSQSQHLCAAAVHDSTRRRLWSVITFRVSRIIDVKR